MSSITSATSEIPSNPFATRFTRPGELEYCFESNASPSVSAPSLGRVQSGESLIEHVIESLIRHRTGLIVGPHGSGKTTLLHTLVPKLHAHYRSIQVLRLTGCQSKGFAQRWGHVRQVDRVIRQAFSEAAGQDSLRVIDGAEQIPWHHWRQLLRHTGRTGCALLATSHRPLSRAPVLYWTGLSATLIETLTGQLLAEAPPEIAALVSDELRQRDLDRVSNLRELWFELYDVVQPRLIQAEYDQASSKQNGCAIVCRSNPVATADRFGPTDG